MNSLSFLGSNIVSTLSNFSSFCGPLGGVSFVVLWISPGIDSVVVVWYSWGLCESSLSSNIVSTLSYFSSFSGPLGRVSFVVLRISPSIDSVVVVWKVGVDLYIRAS